ncbi:MAG: isoprenyl transferase [Aureliella sp.]
MSDSNSAPANKLADSESGEQLLDDVPQELRPRHIAMIMDGNGRWAQQRGLERIEGHLRGVETVRTVMEACKEFGIQVLTLYCFSSENWKRPEAELDFLMELLKRYLIDERATLVENNLRVRVIGREEGLPPEVLHEIQQTLDACENNTGMTLCLAINYGSRSEIIDAVKAILTDAKESRIPVEEVSESLLASKLYTAGLPDPDLLVRTSGEMRISNFLLWQISYAEIWVTQTHWPDFGRENLAEAIRAYAARDRRYGGLSPGAGS